VTTRAAVYALIAPDLGGYAGNVTSGTATTAILDGLAGINRDDESLRYATLIFPDAATSADRQRVITEWNPRTGEARWLGDRTDTTYTSETFLVFPQGLTSLYELNLRLNECLRETRHKAENVIPTKDGDQYYRLTWGWLRNSADVLAVELRESPCLIDNEEFEAWPDGPAAAPAGWTLSGSGASVARTSDIGRRGRYAVQVTRSGATTRLTQTVGLLADDLRGETVSARVDGVTSVASQLRIGISDGLTETVSDFHTGGGTIETLTVEKTLSATATNLSIFTELAVDGAATADRVLAARGDIPDQLADYGSTGYRREGRRFFPRDVNGTVVIEVPGAIGRGKQLLVVTAQPYPEVSTDSATIDAEADLLRHGLIHFLARRYKEGEAPERLERVRGDHMREYMGRAGRLLKVPALPNAQPQIVVGGA
jgi:hypothetical protein